MPSRFARNGTATRLNLSARRKSRKYTKRKVFLCRKMECSALGCKNERSRGCVMFPFPSDPHWRDLWIQNCRKDESTPIENARLCEVHFELSEFKHKEKGLMQLKVSAVPTLFNFSEVEEVTEQSKDESPSISNPLLPPTDIGPSDDQLCPSWEDLIGEKNESEDEEESCVKIEGESSQDALPKKGILLQVLNDDTALCEEEDISMRDGTPSPGSPDEADISSLDLQQRHNDSTVKDNNHKVTCRLCTSTIKVNETVNVFEAEIESFELINIIKQCLRIQIHEDDNLPKNVCLQCCEKLADFFEFFSFCTESQKTLVKSYPSSDKGIRRKKIKMGEDYDSQEISRYGLRKLRKRYHRGMVDSSDDRLENDSGSPDSTTGRMVGVGKTGRVQILEENISPGISTQEVLENYRWECTDCGEDLGSLKALKLHHSDEHNQPPSFKCIECGQTFTIYRSFVRHVKIHNQPKRFGCTKCGKKFAQKNILQSHMMLHTNLRPFACSHCDKSFRQHEALYSHMKSHLPKEARSDVVCPVCRKRMSSKHRLSTHLKTHSNDFACNICNTNFVSMAALECHSLTHSGDNANYCDLCEKSFQTVGRFNEHNAVLHSDVQFYQCHVCGKDFRDQALLRDHASCHMAYLCEYCGKGFRSKHLLRVHLPQHSGKRPYRCPQCSRTFSNSANLNQHTKAQHGQVLVIDNDSPPSPFSGSPSFLSFIEVDD